MTETTVTGPTWEVAVEEATEEEEETESVAVGVSVVEEEGERRPE